MSTSIIDNLFSNHMEDLVKQFVQDKLETIMKEEMKNFFEVEHPDLKYSKNGYYERMLDTRFGRIEDLAVPRDRDGNFRTQLFDPYQRREKWLGETIITMYQNGFSTREIGQFIERILGDSYSAATISNITDVIMEDVQEWQQRPLHNRYSVLYLDGTYLKLRRQEVASEVVYVIVGVRDDGFREIVDFFVGGNESAVGWKNILTNLKNRGLNEVLLGVFDGLSGLEEAFKEVYPLADVQRCVVHKIRNVISSVRKKDKEPILSDLKKVYRALSKEDALLAFDDFKKTWKQGYPKVVQSWEDDLEVLLTFLAYPRIIQSQIYTTNIIERTMKEIKKRTKTMNSLPSEKAVEKIVYLVVQDYNEKWGQRVSTEFASARPALAKMFNDRYGRK